MRPFSRADQQGSTLLVSMIMLVVLTLLVAFSVRMGNTNLRIAGNSQYQAETSAATQEAIEKVIEQIKVTDDVSLIAAQNVPVATGPVTYTVRVEPMNTCRMEAPVLSDSLKDNAADQLCRNSVDGECIQKASGECVPTPTSCKLQQWDIQASVTDPATGAKSSQVQGVSMRVPVTVSCL